MWATNSVLSFLVAKAKGETKILSVHKIKTNQLLRRSTAFSGTETWEKFLPWVLIKGTLCGAVNNVLKNIFSSMVRNYNVQISCKFRLTENLKIHNFLKFQTYLLQNNCMRIVTNCYFFHTSYLELFRLPNQRTL